MQAIFNVAFPIFGVILTGYLAGRWRILGGEATAALNAFVSYFALPVLFFGTLARTPIRAVLDPAMMLPFFIDLSSVPGKVALLMAGLPTAANAFVLAKQFDISVGQNTAAVLLSTAFSVITVSALLVWLRIS